MLQFLTVLIAASLAVARPAATNSVAFVNPTSDGGSWLDVAGTGVGEPMNVSLL